jgi:hypothetical protein
MQNGRQGMNNNTGGNQPNGGQSMNGNPVANPSNGMQNGRQRMPNNPGNYRPDDQRFNAKPAAGMEQGRQGINNVQGATNPSVTPVTPPNGSNQPNVYPGRRQGMNNAPATNGQAPATPGNNQIPPAQGVRPGGNQTPPAQGAPGTNKTPAKTPARTRVPVKTPPPPVKTEKP